MEAKHTPGPWMIDDDIVYAMDTGAYRGTQRFAFVPMHGRGSSNPIERNANARLIAAAPDLLDACANALDAINAETDCGQSYESECPLCAAKKILRAAIAKAKGES